MAVAIMDDDEAVTRQQGYSEEDADAIIESK
jgi:hypothetical protein